MLQYISQILLWISVITWSLWFGGLMYEMVIILPLWSSALPESVIEWNSRPQFLINPTKFYLPVALTCVLSSLGALITTWKIGKNCLWHLISAVSAIATLGFRGKAEISEIRPNSVEQVGVKPTKQGEFYSSVFNAVLSENRKLWV